MSYLGNPNIDDLLTFSVTTATPSTGAAVDADAVPAYRVYEDETGTAILTGNMAKLDDANTTGFYSEQLSLSSANGFEVGKSYTVYISAAVAGVTGTTERHFTVGIKSTLTAAQVTAIAEATWSHATAVALINAVAAIPLAVWNVLTSALTLVGSIGKWILDNTGSTGGSGAFEVNLTIKDAAEVIVTDCDVILTTSNESPRVGIYATAVSDGNGIVTFYVDAGVYYVWRQKGGVNFTNPITIIVDADGDVTLG